MAIMKWAVGNSLTFLKLVVATSERAQSSCGPEILQASQRGLCAWFHAGMPHASGHQRQIGRPNSCRECARHPDPS